MESPQDQSICVVFLLNAQIDTYSNFVKTKPYRFNDKVLSQFEAAFSDASQQRVEKIVFVSIHPLKSSVALVLRNPMLYKANVQEVYGYKKPDGSKQRSVVCVVLQALCRNVLATFISS